MASGQRIGYIRVSSLDQNPARQREQLQELSLDRIYEDHASGKNTSERPELKAMLEYIRSGDELYVTSMDRLARNLEDLLRIVRQLNDKGVAVHFLKEHQSITADGAGSMSRLILGVMGAVAEFERELIRERQREGIALAKERGAYKGRKPTDKAKIEQALALIQDGIPKSKAACKVGIARATLYKYIKAMKTPVR